MKIFALVMALAFTAPLAAMAAPLTVEQKVQQTYHTQFPATQSTVSNSNTAG